MMDFFVQAPNHGIISGGSHVFRARKPDTSQPQAPPRPRRPVKAATVQRHAREPPLHAANALDGMHADAIAQPGAETNLDEAAAADTDTAGQQGTDRADADRRRFAQQFGEQAAEEAAREVAQHEAQRAGHLGAQYEEGEDVGLRTGAGHRVDVRRGAWDPDSQALEYVVCVVVRTHVRACVRVHRVVESKLHSALAHKAAQQHEGDQTVVEDAAVGNNEQEEQGGAAKNMAQLAVERAMVLLDD